MATYDPQKVLADYAANRITPEMASGHSLQHIVALYDLHKADRQAWQNKLDALETRIGSLQSTVDRLSAVIEKAHAKKKQAALNQPKRDAP